jgi:hypothetical protein
MTDNRPHTEILTVPFKILGLHVDLIDRLYQRPLEVQTGLNDLNQSTVAQQDAALRLVDSIPTAEKNREPE